MKAIKNKVTSIKSFSILLLFVFFVGLQSPVYAELTRAQLYIDITALHDKTFDTKGLAKGVTVADGYRTIQVIGNNSTPRVGDIEYLSDMKIGLAFRNDEIVATWSNGLKSLVPAGKYIYIMDTKELYIHSDKNEDTKGENFGHPVFLGGGELRPMNDESMDVQGAGEIVIGEEGKITYISNQSGHYQPPQAIFVQVLFRLCVGTVKQLDGITIKILSSGDPISLPALPSS